jgi:hypothetical protein
MLLDIIADAVTGQADMELKGSFDTCDGLLAASTPQADVLILSMKLDRLSAACRDLLYVYPRARFLAITDDGKGAFLYALRPHRFPVGELTLNDLLAAIRGDVSNTPGEWNEVTTEIGSDLKLADLAAMKRSEG